MNSRCFLFEPTKLDIESVSNYGRPVYLFGQISRRPLRDQLLEVQIVERLEELKFNADEDFIVLSGSQLAVLILATSAVSFYGTIRMLAFDAVKQRYFERSMGHALDMAGENSDDWAEDFCEHSFGEIG